jgi:hypothetical protein
MRNVSPDLACLYEMGRNYKFLYNYWLSTNGRKVSEEDLKKRLEYLINNKVKQRDEISTLCWVLGINDERTNDN